MTLATSVTTDPPAPLPPDEVYGWDWTATTHDVRDGVVEDLATALGTSLALPGKGLQGWTRSVQCFDRRGDRIAQVYFGGGRDDVHVQATGESAQWARSAVAGLDRPRTSRVDTRFDTLTPFEDLEALIMQAASTYNAQVLYQESRTGPRAGRTLYLGAPSSAIRVRVYEKHKESPGQYVDGTNRVEVQLRPPSRMKEKVSGWTPAMTFCASKTTRDLAALLGADASEPGSLHVAKPTPTLEQSLEAMADQYGASVARWLEHSGGDFTTVIDYLLNQHDQQDQARQDRATVAQRRQEPRRGGLFPSEAAERLRARSEALSDH